MRCTSPSPAAGARRRRCRTSATPCRDGHQIRRSDSVPRGRPPRRSGGYGPVRDVPSGGPGRPSRGGLVVAAAVGRRCPVRVRPSGRRRSADPTSSPVPSPSSPGPRCPVSSTAPPPWSAPWAACRGPSSASVSRTDLIAGLDIQADLTGLHIVLTRPRAPNRALQPAAAPTTPRFQRRSPALSVTGERIGAGLACTPSAYMVAPQRSKFLCRLPCRKMGKAGGPLRPDND